MTCSLHNMKRNQKTLWRWNENLFRNGFAPSTDCTKCDLSSWLLSADAHTTALTLVYTCNGKVNGYLPSCNGSIVWIISWRRPWRNLAPVTVPAWLLCAVAPLLEPGGPDLVSEAARDVTEPPGWVAIEVSDELAALPFFVFVFDFFF